MILKKNILTFKKEQQTNQILLRRKQITKLSVNV